MLRVTGGILAHTTTTAKRYFLGKVWWAKADQLGHLSRHCLASGWWVIFAEHKPYPYTQLQDLAVSCRFF